MKRVRGVHCTPKNLDVPSKMKVKGYMYLQMKKPVGMLMPNLRNRYISAERKISQKNPEYMLNYSLPCSYF
jgi:hypothetical protein